MSSSDNWSTEMKKLCMLVLAVLIGMPQFSFSQEKWVNAVFIPKSSDQMFWDLMRQGVDRAVREDGHAKLTWRGPAHNDDTDSQIRILEAYTKPGVDAILITPTDRARLVEPIRAATALRIKVVVVDSALDGNHHTNMVTTDNVRAGKLAAKKMAELLNNQGSVLVLRTVVGSASTDERAEGFRAYLKDNAPRIKVLEDLHGGGSVGKLRHSALGMLEKSPGVNGVFAVNESSTDGMLRALRDRGLAGKVSFIGFDSTDLLNQAVERQEISALVIQDPQQMGYMGVKAALAAARNAPMKDKMVFTDTKLLTRENMQSPEIKQLICIRC
jgi:ribose transport system substrate-binding protein